LNSIPTAAIERVEVLKDGASAVYGSDAIAGVVNIITRRRVNGVELSAYGGLSPHNDAQQYDLSATGGAASDKGSFMFSVGYFDQRAMFAENRDWAKTALTFHFDPASPIQVTQGGSPTIPVGRASVNIGQVSATNPADACNGNPLCTQLKNTFSTALACKATGTCNKTFIFDTTAPACSGPVAPGTDFTACQVGGWRPMVGPKLNAQNGPTNDLYNFQAVNYLITPSQRIQLFSNGDYNPLNVLADDAGLTGWVDFELSCFEDPLIGFPKFHFWSDDRGWSLAAQIGLVERYLYRHHVTPEAFLVRVALRGLTHLHDTTPDDPPVVMLKEIQHAVDTLRNHNRGERAAGLGPVGAYLHLASRKHATKMPARSAHRCRVLA